jgi:hypothetical protein
MDFSLTTVSRMRALLLVVATGASLAVPFQLARDSGTQSAHAGYLGFDRNDYPGDANLKVLRQTFSYSGYWLNKPPGENSNSWVGKRKTLQAAGFGFLVLFSGRTHTQIKSAGDAAKLGSSDAAAAVSAARREGFPSQTIIFLDQEEGGRLLPEQRSYLHAWVDGMNSAGFRAGVYCSGIASKEASGASVVTAEDIKQNAGGRKLEYWVVNDRAHRHLDARFRKRFPRPRPVVFSLRKSGSSLNHPSDLISQAVALRITTMMETVIRPAWILPNACTWTSISQVQAILLRAERATDHRKLNSRTATFVHSGPLAVAVEKSAFHR